MLNITALLQWEPYDTAPKIKKYCTVKIGLDLSFFKKLKKNNSVPGQTNVNTYNKRCNKCSK
jgi:hypothetical protein